MSKKEREAQPLLLRRGDCLKVISNYDINDKFLEKDWAHRKEAAGDYWPHLELYLASCLSPACIHVVSSFLQIIQFQFVNCLKNLYINDARD